MKFSCEKTLLQAAISTISRAISPKSSIPALEGVLLETGNNLHLTDYNLETGIRTVVPADIREEGTPVLDARLFGEIVRKLPNDIITLQSEDYMVNIKYGISEFSILDTDPEGFPELPIVEHQNLLILPQSKLRTMISQTLFATSDSESRPIHTGSPFEVDGEGLTIVSVDDCRLALRREPVNKEEGTETLSFVVPDATLSEMEKICNDMDEPASVTQGACHMMFKVGGATLVSRRLKGEFLTYRRAIPHNDTIHVEGDTRAPFSSIDRVSLTISDKLKGPLRCVFDSNLLEISIETAIGDAYDEYPLSDDGGGLETGFNNKYLMNALRAAPADEVRLGLTIGVSLCVILPTEREKNFLYMVLPVRLKAGE